MIYLISKYNLISEEKISFRSSVNKIHPFIEVPVNSTWRSCKIETGMYDFFNDKKYYMPAIIGSVILRSIHRTYCETKNDNYGSYYVPTRYYKYVITIDWLSNDIYNRSIQFHINTTLFDIKKLFSVIIPFINRAVANKDSGIYIDLLIFSRLMSFDKGLGALVGNNKERHKNYGAVRNANDMFAELKVSGYHAYSYRAGRDDYETDKMVVSLPKSNNLTNVLLHNAIKRSWDRVSVEEKNDLIIYYITLSSSYSYACSEGYQYDAKECAKLKDDLMQKINAAYLEILEKFTDDFSRYIKNYKSR